MLEGVGKDRRGRGGPLRARGRSRGAARDDDQANMRTRRNCAVTMALTAIRTAGAERRPAASGRWRPVCELSDMTLRWCLAAVS